MNSIVLTGAAGGIGMAVVRDLTKLGYTTYAGYIDDWELSQLEALKTELQTDLIVPVLIDLREPQHVEDVIGRVERENPELAGLICNGAVSPFGVPLEYVDFDITRECYEINLIGNARLIQRSLKMLKKSKGRVLLVGSLFGKTAGGMLLSYAASKHAMEALAIVARRELKPFDIDVIIFNPGLVKRTYMAANHHERSKEVLQALGSTSDRTSPMTYDVGRNTQLRNPQPVVDPSYEKDYAGLNWMLRYGLHPDKMKMLATPEECSKVYIKALTSKRPKTRYIIGPDAKAFIFMSWLLPTRWFDKIAVAMSIR